MLWSDKTVDKEGYVRVKSSFEYLDLPLAFQKHPKFSKSSKSIQLATARGDLIPVGVLREDEYRTTSAFSHGSSTIALTTWNYRSAGAVFSVPEEFLNQKVAGNPAVLSLSYADKSDLALWKLTWWGNGVMYELYATDLLDSKKIPNYKPHQILHFADLALRRSSK